VRGSKVTAEGVAKARRLRRTPTKAGSQHLEEAEYDRRRTAFLNARGYSVLRFWNPEVLRHIDGVHEFIAATIAGIDVDPSPGWRYSPATLSPEGRGDVTERTE
jgi:hypothetical protein